MSSVPTADNPTETQEGQSQTFPMASSSEEQKQQQQQTPEQTAEAQKKLEQLRQPVHEELMEKQEQTHQRIIAVALDQSEHSEYAFNWALENLINPQSDQVVLLNVREVVNVPASFGLIYMDIRDWIDRTEYEQMMVSHKLLKHFGARIVKAGAKCRAIALRGDPRDELLHKVKEVNADMLVIGSRGMGTLKRAFVGSVSDYCVHNSECPVVVVRHKHEKEMHPKKTHA
ncbi:uncharacterized protein EV422DRAFT_59939 [Fimicolochytrium jonesii]|uniref:uncharacterized protein n=1 Tax=Fimicolochytrium jonesii TaxID=1396493 RepID=UPI0022FE6382|nr:uncharacterized protein EV422DRAFT_59939 [Fimicolochytrium jonesii]KAI8820700.1 hypothetical protein EV422DRAFT_59939 [Fimicolochytrium jonesii]